jgi:hypothetical protein
MRNPLRSVSSFAKFIPNLYQNLRDFVCQVLVGHLPDPNGLYANFLHDCPGFAKSEVVPPVVIDSDGSVITPNQYGTHLVHLTPVLVEANIRL